MNGVGNDSQGVLVLGQPISHGNWMLPLEEDLNEEFILPYRMSKQEQECLK